MNRHLYIAAIAALVVTVTAPAEICFVVDEWCQVGCETLVGYVVDTFPSTDAATAFITTLSPIQRETVRVTSFAQPNRRVAVLYRLTIGQARPADPGSDTCLASRRPALREVNSIEAAAFELAQLPLEVRATAAIVSVRGVPNLPHSGAVLVYLEPYRLRGDDTAAGMR